MTVEDVTPPHHLSCECAPCANWWSRRQQLIERQSAFAKGIAAGFALGVAFSIFLMVAL